MAKLKTKSGDKKSAGKTEAGAALEHSPSHLLHRALQLALDIYADETGPDALTQRQYAVLAAVAAHQGLTQTDLVRATGIDRSTLADLVARMIGKNLIARERSATDARANTVRLTEPGSAALAATGPKVAAADARILELLPPRKRDAFLTVLSEMGRASEPAAAPKAKKKKAKAKDKAGKAAKAPKPAKAVKIDGGGKRKKAKKAEAMAESTV
jgi:MarR family transcriptional regulator, temperature-dependent positive regulator of motility